ncbi:MAG: hypothetical protein KJ718_00745 [Nanoarchaeota archaeon]|nr:hypothetical protein [Nanoarchaeota archaeon]MBU1051068.1 hypothetical protein [Nanoarchaeota archaeon]
MNKKWWVLIVVLVVILVVVGSQNEIMKGPPTEISASKGTGSFKAEPELESTTRSQYLGFLSVTNFTNQSDLFASLEIASENADYLMFVSNVNWSQYTEGWGGGVDDSLFDELMLWKNISDIYGFDFYVNINVLEGTDRSLIDQSIPWDDKSFANPLVREAFKNYAKRVAVEIQPEYLTLGMEVNTYAADNSWDYENFLSLYDETFEFIKQDSLEIKIGTTFQYD